jgi:hypothetical protein
MRIREFASGLLGVLAVAAACSPSQARACSCSPSPLFKFNADPKDGATDVPLNKALVIEGAFKLGSVTVEDSVGQRVEDLTINESTNPGCGGTWAEIIPNQPWRPRTTYIIRVQAVHLSEASPEASSLTFVAGVDSLPEPELTVPKGRASILTGLPEPAACGPVKATTCINVEGQTEARRDVEIIARRGDRVLLRTLMPINDANFGFDEVPDCLELRRRSPTGKRSKPLMLCGDDLLATKYLEQSTNWADWPTCENGRYSKARTSAPGGNDSDLPKPSSGPADEPGTGSDAAGAPPSAAGHTAGSRADDSAEPSHREYGCAATTPRKCANTGAGWLVLAMLAMSAFVRRRASRRQRRPRTARARSTRSLRT